MPPRPVIAVVLLLLISTLSGALWGSWQRAEALRYKGTAEALANDLGAAQAALEASRKELAVVRRALGRAKERSQMFEVELQEVLREHKEWAATPTPAAVSDSLCQYLSCAPSRPSKVPAPDG